MSASSGRSLCGSSNREITGNDTATICTKCRPYFRESWPLCPGCGRRVFDVVAALDTRRAGLDYSAFSGECPSCAHVEVALKEAGVETLRELAALEDEWQTARHEIARAVQECFPDRADKILRTLERRLAS